MPGLAEHHYTRHRRRLYRGTDSGMIAHQPKKQAMKWQMHGIAPVRGPRSQSDLRGAAGILTRQQLRRRALSAVLPSAAVERRPRNPVTAQPARRRPIQLRVLKDAAHLPGTAWPGRRARPGRCRVVIPRRTTSSGRLWRSPECRSAGGSGRREIRLDSGSGVGACQAADAERHSGGPVREQRSRAGEPTG
jgi:hypothetical protein